MGNCIKLTAEVISEANEIQANENSNHANIQEYPNQMIEVGDNANRLSQINVDEVEKVPYKGKVIEARIIDIHDGDTMKVVFMYGNKPFKIAIRILGIDAPEITAGAGRLPEEKIAAIKVRDFLIDYFKDKTTGRFSIVDVKIDDWDKYGGRVLADVILEDGRTITDLLIEKGYGRRYDGEKKHKWTLEELTTGPFAN